MANEIPDDIDSLIRAAEQIIADNRSRTMAKRQSRMSSNIVLPTTATIPTDEPSSRSNDEPQSVSNSSFYNDEATSTNSIVSISSSGSDIIDLCNTPTSTSMSFKPSRRRKMPQSGDVIVIDDSPPPKRSPPGKSSGESTDTSIARCPVCLESAVEKNPISTICGHIFCLACITQAMRVFKKCPVCKRKISKRSIHNIFL